MAQINKENLRGFLVISIALLLQGCGVQPLCPPKTAATPQITSNDPTIQPYKVAGSFAPETPIAEVKENLKNASGVNEQQAAIGALRAQALRETALSIGARGGLAERAQKINTTFINYEPLL